MKKSIFLGLFIASGMPIFAEIGCMEASKHAYLCRYKGEDCCSYDYKTLHYVYCSCPCWRYRQTNICTQCRHFRQPQELPIIFK